MIALSSFINRTKKFNTPFPMRPFKATFNFSSRFFCFVLFFISDQMALSVPDGTVFIFSQLRLLLPVLVEYFRFMFKSCLAVQPLVDWSVEVSELC